MRESGKRRAVDRYVRGRVTRQVALRRGSSTYFNLMRTSGVVRTTMLGRLIAVVTCAALLVASGAQAAGLHRCPVHDAPLAAMSSPHHSPGEHAGHAGPVDHDGAPSHQQAPHCCCIDEGCCSAPLSSLTGGATAADLPARFVLTLPTGAGLLAPVVAPYLTPPSTGPPPAALA